MNQSRKDRVRELVFQFLIVLVGVDPLVWRRILVPGRYTFWDLHVAIQDAMGWQDYHLHEFKVLDPASMEQVRIVIPFDDEPYEKETLPDYLTPISDYFVYDNEIALYTYDFGDGWRHVVAFEDWVQPEKGVQYPQCLSGERRCPPEDCGGPGGYGLFLEAIQDPEHEEHEEYLTWVGGEFDPEAFDPEQVRFDDPEERWRTAFEEP
ncbi:MAG TPA: plasmid pRiA4b ORF-3 family protein [Methanosarcinales archaeon]|nr:plasmid pRiA4b ORF-3 family protein [Methanosarcinales archaeon]